MLYEIGDLLKLRSAIKSKYHQGALVIGYGEHADDIKGFYSYYKLFSADSGNIMELSTLAAESLYEKV